MDSFRVRLILELNVEELEAECIVSSKDAGLVAKEAVEEALRHAENRGFNFAGNDVISVNLYGSEIADVEWLPGEEG